MLYFAVLLAFIGATFYNKLWWLGGIESAVFIALLILYLRQRSHRNNMIVKYIEAAASSTSFAAGNSLINMPIPIALVRVGTNEIIWGNDSFSSLTGCDEQCPGIDVSELLKNFDIRWILDGKESYPDILHVGSRSFYVYGSLIRSAKPESGSLFAALYLLECTREVELQRQMEFNRLVAAEILCDNYEELGKGGLETARAAMMALLEDRIDEWTKNINSLLRRADRDRYVLITDEKSYQLLAETRFDLLESAKKIVSPNGLPLTVSIGIGRDSADLDELDRASKLALDMALSRGGDQAVVKSRSGFEFFGGMTKEIEKRTKVKTRLMANVFNGLLHESTDVFVMGHRIADLDSLGGAAGVVCAARKLGKEAYIVIEREFTNAGLLIDLLETHQSYEGVMISPREALLRMSAGSLLVVVDTNRADYVEDKALLESFNRIVVIDHHRRVANYIDNADLNIHEPAASSVCELIAEVLQYIIEQGDMLSVEASALMAGIVLDTKSFALKTGSRTFEAAAYLRRCGADALEIKKLFQSDLDNYISRAELVKDAEFLDGMYAISMTEKSVDRAVAAQAADDLMNIIGVACSFVIHPFEDSINISARSLGRVNVQVLMEKLGGGGHFTTAGAQIRGKNVKEVVSMLKDTITVYNYEN